MIAPAMPADGGHGLAMRLGVFLEALANVAEVDLAVLPVAASANEPSPQVARMGIRTGIFSCANRPEMHFSLLSRLKDPTARLEAFVRYGRPSLAAVSLAVINELYAAAAGYKYDLVHVGRVYLAPVAQQWCGSSTKMSLDLDEDDRAAAESIAHLERSTGRLDAAAWMEAEALAHDRLVAEFAPRFDSLWISSPVDRRSLKSRNVMLDPIVIANAVRQAEIRPRADDGYTLLFIGSFGYPPNVDAVLWFAQFVWPALRRKVGSRLRLLVVGPDTPPVVQSLRYRPGIIVTGRLADLAPIYARASLVVLPFRAGGGTRIKLLEAASHGVAIIATRVGAAGLPVRRFQCGWIADGPQHFTAACLSGLSDPIERNRRGARGRAMVRQEYERSQVVRRLSCAFTALLRK
jgi:glycosyltransferase involved in cell wall biosynthesis